MRKPNRFLNARQRAFADAWNGPRTGTAAARAAGYAGGDGVLAPIATRMMKDQRIVDRITRRVGAAQWDAWFPPPSIGEERWHAFADGYAGPGTEASAAQDAGYDGRRERLTKIGRDLLDNPRVMRRIWTRVGIEQWEGWCLGMASREHPELEGDPDELAAAIERELAATGPVVTADGERL